MSQIVQCAKCSKKLNAPDELAGKRVACPACKAVVSIPPLAKASNAAASPAIVSSPQKTGSAASKAAPNAAGACVIQCTLCGKKFKGASSLHGKKVRCPVCKSDFTVRIAAAAAPTPTKPVATKNPPSGPAKANPAAPKSPVRSQPIAKAAAAPVKAVAPSPISGAKALIATPKKAADPKPVAQKLGPRARPRLLYFAFALAFLPLVWQTLGTKNDVEERMSHMVAAHPELEKQLDSADESTEKADIFALFPDGRIEGAHLSYFSRVHWLYAAIAAAAFFAAGWFLFDPGRATMVQWLVILGVTSTVGIVSLLLFQFVAEVTQGVWISGRSILVLLFYIVKFIGYSYHAASDPDTGFLLSFLGFTFGVGLCEEITKALPVIIWLGKDKKLDWRAACMLGLASGVGFGVAEGIMYAGHYYNGVMPGDIYLTRFISCVALHATWTAAACLMAHQNLAGFETNDFKDWTMQLLIVVSVPAVLHGLYDTLLKKEMQGFALLVALASFGWLAFMLERLRYENSDVTPGRGLVRIQAT
jgi:RsiW-degrading membrane proteinase PrsW (M82 family)/DNA-directed RNA polymerase subunit RPC12/RpoP